MDWISVKDYLPDVGEHVLITNGGFVCESFINTDNKWIRGGVELFFITPTHWAKMPNPPKTLE